MEKPNLQILKVEVNSVYGKTEKESNGSITKIQCTQKKTLKELILTSQIQIDLRQTMGRKVLNNEYIIKLDSKI